MDAGVAIAIAHERVTVRGNSHVRRTIEGTAGLRHSRRGATVVVTRIGWVLGRPALEQLFAVERVPGDSMLRVVDEVQRVVRGHVHTVGAVGELTLAPGV